MHGGIDNDVYIDPPSGVDICGANECLKLKKGLYGLKRAPRLWNEKWKTLAKEFGFEALKGDLCLFSNGTGWLLLYVDEILLISTEITAIESTKKRLKSKLDVKDMGQLSQFLGVKLSWSDGTLYPSQEGYVDKFFKNYNYRTERVSTLRSGY